DAVSGRRSRQWTSLSPYQFPVDRRPECFDRRCAHRHRVKDTNESFSHGTRTTMIIRYDKLRYRLLPYSYSLAWREACDDHSLPPGLPVDCPDDRRARDVGDQFMFGPAFLVAPITEPGADSRSVYLPEAAAWYDFWTGKQLSWTDAIEVSAPLERIPLFVRAGSIVPFGPVAQDADDPLDPLEVRVYPGANGEFEWYPDAADAYDCEKG